MQNQSYSTSQPLTVVHQDSLNQNVVVGNTLLGIVGILIFGGLILGAVLQKRHHAYRAKLLYQQIEVLERMWQLPSKK